MGLWEQMQRAEKKRALANALVQSKAPNKTKAIKTANEPQGAARRGPKPSGSAKRLISLRLDPEVIDGFRSTGDGWQARMNAVLRSHLGL